MVIDLEREKLQGLKSECETDCSAWSRNGMQRIQSRKKRNQAGLLEEKLEHTKLCGNLAEQSC